MRMTTTARPTNRTSPRTGLQVGPKITSRTQKPLSARGRYIIGFAVRKPMPWTSTLKIKINSMQKEILPIRQCDSSKEVFLTADMILTMTMFPSGIRRGSRMKRQYRSFSRHLYRLQIRCGVTVALTLGRYVTGLRAPSEEEYLSMS